MALLKTIHRALLADTRLSGNARLRSAHWPMPWPIFTAASMARAIGRSMPTANTVIERFAEAGIVRQINIGKRNRAFEAQGIIEAFIGFERAAASPANDTLVSKPVRPVPFKEVR